MKIAFLIGPTCIGDRPFDFSAIETSKRGLTGTDGSFLYYARAMHQRGHDVTLYVDRALHTTWDGISVKPWLYRREIDSSFDAACCWVDVQGLRWVPDSVVRLVNMQLNNFDFSRGGPDGGWMSKVDVFTAPSQMLANRLQGIASAWTSATWEVLPNGCNPADYTPNVKIPGRCIYTSSPDRGLHIVLEQWARIRAAVPHATLKIFYHALEEWVGRAGEMEYVFKRWGQADIGEQARRARIIERLLHQDGIERVGSVSRQQMAREYSEAEVLCYPCDTISFTEGFGTAVLEGCAAGAVPVITDCDAFGEVYRGACPMVERVTDGWENQWGNLAIHVLARSGEFRWAGSEFAAKHAWPVLAERLEGVIGEAKARKTAGICTCGNWGYCDFCKSKARSGAGASA